LPAGSFQPITGPPSPDWQAVPSAMPSSSRQASPATSASWSAGTPCTSWPSPCCSSSFRFPVPQTQAP